jgi:ribonuclease-3
MSDSNQRFTSTQLEGIQEKLGYEFDDHTLLKKALTHSSLSHRGLDHNERLEFLGDSVLETVICEHLFRSFPELPEGRLSEIRSVVVSSSSLFKTASNLALEDHCRVSKGLMQQDQIPDSILANMVEALIASIYLDGGLEPARSFILDHLDPIISEVVESASTLDYKSLLQQYTQKRWNKIPHYNIVSEQGPDHDKHFKATVSIRGEAYGPGTGTSKQEAESDAARKAIDALDIDISDLR